MNFEKLKETARKYEQKEEWRRAIEVYLQAVQEFEAGHEPVPDLSIYNRIGDLYLKANEPGAAVQAYERATDLYGDQGFYNNAIALCGKILRVNPGRIHTYLKLAQLHARKNVVIDAKKNLLEYLERMNALGQLDAAFKSLKEFAEQFPGNKDIRLMLVELLRASSRNEEAREELEKLASDLEARGDTVGARRTLMRLQALEAEESGEKAPTGPPSGKSKTKDLVFLETGSEKATTGPQKAAGRAPRKTISTTGAGRKTPTRPAPHAASAGLPLIDLSEEPPEAKVKPERGSEPLQIETSSLVDTPLALEPSKPISDEARLEATAAGDIARTLGFEPTQVEAGAVDAVSPVEGLELDQPMPDQVDLETQISGLELERASDLGAEEGPGLAQAAGGPGEVLLPDPLDATPELAADLVLDLEPVPEAPGPDLGEAMGLELIEPGEPIPAEPSIAELEDRVLDDPDDPEAHRALGEALVAAGEPLRGQEELELALAGYESKEDWHHAAALVEELIRLDPNGVRYHQKQVEIAFRSGDRGRLLEAYLELADSLVRVGAVDKAVAVYRRVAEHDPENQRALAAISALSVAEEVGFAPGGAAHEALSPAGAGQPGAPPEAEGDTDESFVDLGALVLEDARPKDTRMRVEGEEPTGDEQRDFQDMLVQFRRGIEENIAAEDFQAHYDLGVAFKEMGLLDEAIAEFQKALRSPEVRLKTTEALGSAFFEKEQYAIAEAILRRGIESLGAADDEQIGLLYWLGRSQEAQGKFADALPNYERVLAVEIGFQDAGQRMSKLSAKRAR